MEEIPAYLQHLPRHGAFVIPFFTLIKADGRPDFRAHDDERHQRAMAKRLCGVCGVALGYWIYFIGGPHTIRERLSYMPAMHENCARYSMQVCPFLALEEHTHSLRPVSAGNVKRVSDEDMPPKPHRAGLARTRSYVIEYAPGRAMGGAEYAAFAPPKQVEWFHYVDGRLVPE
jgi:hypothetical protein